MPMKTINATEDINPNEDNNVIKNHWCWRMIWMSMISLVTPVIIVISTLLKVKDTICEDEFHRYRWIPCMACMHSMSQETPDIIILLLLEILIIILIDVNIPLYVIEDYERLCISLISYLWMSLDTTDSTGSTGYYNIIRDKDVIEEYGRSKCQWRLRIHRSLWTWSCIHNI